MFQFSLHVYEKVLKFLGNYLSIEHKSCEVSIDEYLVWDLIILFAI